MARVRLDDQLCFSLYSATNAIVRAYRPRLRALALTYPQLLVLMVLFQDGPSTVGHIARRLSLSSSAVTPLVGRLVEVGYVDRERDGADARIVRVAMSPTGAALEPLIFDIQGAVAGATGLGDTGLGALRTRLTSLTSTLSAAERGDPAAQPKKTSASA